MATMQVRHEAGDRFRIAIRGHEVVVDQPMYDGGGDAGPTPTELFVAALASCVAYYAERFLVRHDVDPAGLAVRCDWEMAGDRPARVGSIAVQVTPPYDLPAKLLDRLQAVVEGCTVHNSLVRPPSVSIDARVMPGAA
jgi:putative redox protein